MKRLWENYSVYFHMAGFLILAVFMAGEFFSGAQADSLDVKDLKYRMDIQEKTSVQIIQRLDDIKEFLHVPSRTY